MVSKQEMVGLVIDRSIFKGALREKAIVTVQYSMSKGPVTFKMSGH